MAKPVNLIRNVKAILKPKDITTFGKRWAVQDGADGYPMVNVTVTDTTQDVKMYLEGSNEITVYPVASDVSKLCKGALMSFPNIDTIFLFSAEMVDIAEETQGLGDYLSYLSLLSKIYVPSALLDDYKNAYASLSSKFDIIVEDLTITIEWVGNNTLTSEEITRQLNTLESAYLNQATKLVIDDRYTDYLDTLWAYNFTEKIPYLNNNIWHGATKIDLTAFEITGSGTLTSEIIESSIASISSDKLSGITKIIIDSGFTNVSSNPFADITVILPNVEKLELKGNTRFYRINALSWVKELTLNDYSGSYNLYLSGLVQAGYTFIFKGTQYVNFIDTSWAKNIIAETQETISGFGLTNWRVKADIYAPKAKTVNGFSGASSSKIYFPNLETFNNSLGNQYNYWGFIYIVKPNIVLTGTINESYLPKKPNAQSYQFSGFVTTYNLLEHYMNKVDSNWEKIRNVGCLFGVLHICSILPTFTGQEVGNFIGQIYYDKETNKQWKWTENGWVEYASGFPTGYYDNTQWDERWFSDDRLVNAISTPTNASADGDYYLKLVWNNPTLTINAKSGETTLTSAIVTRELAKASSNKSVVTKVIVPVDFTAYDSGTITAIQNAGFTNLRYLETTYSGGAMELDLQGDIVAKIVEIGKTLDEALVYARTFNSSYSQNDLNLIIIPPLSIKLGDNGAFVGCSNLVYVAKNSMPTTGSYVFIEIKSLIKIEELTVDNNYPNASFINRCDNLAEMKIIYLSCTYTQTMTITRTKFVKIIMQGYIQDLDVSGGLSSNITREALVDLINSLGTPSTQKTLTIGATNLAKLTAEDIAIATAKNWVVQ